MEQRNRIQLISVIVVVVVLAFAISRSHKNGPLVLNPNQPINSVNYYCNLGKTIQAVYYQGESIPSTSTDLPPTPGGSVALKLSDGRMFTLAQTLSADGARYASADESFVFWSKGNGALVLENNEEKSYIGCIRVADMPEGANLSQIYVNNSEGFSLRFPSVVASTSVGYNDSFKVDESYRYQQLGPGKDILGIKFTIPLSMATGTNLSSDSYISVEQIPQRQECNASYFMYGATPVQRVDEGDMTYSVASSTDAGAGNRYEEIVFAIPGTNPCMAVRYFIHYGVYENYPAGTIKQFDHAALLAEFDAIRRTLVVRQ